MNPHNVHIIHQVPISDVVQTNVRYIVPTASSSSQVLLLPQQAQGQILQQTAPGRTQILQSSQGQTQILQPAQGQTHILQQTPGQTQILQPPQGQTQILQAAPQYFVYTSPQEPTQQTLYQQVQPQQSVVPMMSVIPTTSIQYSEVNSPNPIVQMVLPSEEVLLPTAEPLSHPEDAVLEEYPAPLPSQDFLYCSDPFDPSEPSPSQSSELPQFVDERYLYESSTASRAQPPSAGVSDADQFAYGKTLVPCSHNSWENVRVRKGKMTVRCAACQGQWTHASDIVWRVMRCKEYSNRSGCWRGDSCSRLHFSRRKMLLTDRIKIHGKESIHPAALESDSVAPSPPEETITYRIKENSETARSREVKGKGRGGGGGVMGVGSRSSFVGEGRPNGEGRPSGEGRRERRGRGEKGAK